MILPHALARIPGDTLNAVKRVTADGTTPVVHQPLASALSRHIAQDEHNVDVVARTSV